jgi:hypothetical protein
MKTLMIAAPVYSASAEGPSGPPDAVSKLELQHSWPLGGSGIGLALVSSALAFTLSRWRVALDDKACMSTGLGQRQR